MKFKSIPQFLAFFSVLATGYALSWVFGAIIGWDFNAYFVYKVLRADPTNNVVIVAVDNTSLDALTQSDFRVLNFTKSIYIDLIEKLEKDWAKAIGLDIVLANPDPKEADLAKVLDTYKNIVIATKIGAGDGEQVLPKSVYPRQYWGMIDVLFQKNIVNRISPIHELNGANIEAFSIQVYRKWIHDTSAAGKLVDGFYEINPNRKIPIGEDGTAYIPFLRRVWEYPKISLIDVLGNKFPTWFFKGKAVLIGEYGTLIHDAHFSPVDIGVRMPGIEFHANMIESLIKNTPLRPVSQWISYITLIILSFLTFLVAVYASVWMITSIFLFFPFVLLFTSWYLLASQGVILDVWTFCFVAGISSLIGGSIYRYFVVDAEHRFLSNAFGHYISPDIVRQLSANPDSLSLGGQRRDLTIFFSDIAWFSWISEKLTTEWLFKLMNEYLSEMTDILVKNNGTLDKYIGDSVMGFFWAPLPLERKSYWACKTALEQQKRLVELNSKWASQKIPPIQTRIGIHSGEAMVGNIGSTERFNYTIMGDWVNLASRLEGVNKEYGTLICVSAHTMEEAWRKDFIFRRLDKIQVKWKEETVDIFELVAFSNDNSPAIREKLLRISVYEKALEYYFLWDFSHAKELFRQYPDDAPSCIMWARCVSLLSGTTSLNHGVFVFDYK